MDASKSNPGLLTKAELIKFMKVMNNHAQERGLKYREEEDWTDEYCDMLWKGFNGYTQGTDGVSYSDLLYVSWQIGM